MKAITWHGKHDVRCDTVDDPEILNPRDAIIRITSTAICGSDLHLYDGYVPAMKPGDVLGHEFMGEVVEKSAPASTLKKGQRVVVPFTDLVRPVLPLLEAAVLRLRQRQPGRQAGHRPRSATASRWRGCSATAT